MSGEIETMQSDGMPQNKRYVIAEDPDDFQPINAFPDFISDVDEYCHDDNKLGLVVIFSSINDNKNARLIQQALIDQNYDVPNIYELSTKQGVLERIRIIADEDHSNKTCLILVMLGNSHREGVLIPDDEIDNRKGAITIKDVFTPFTGDCCKSFRDKPKIFIFQSSAPIMTVKADTAIAFSPPPPSQAYQVPTEADILLVYKHAQSRARHSFIESLCNIFHKEGQFDDIIGLVTTTNSEDHKSAFLISTLTKRFYISSSKERHLHHQLHETQNATLETLENLHTNIQTLQKRYKPRNSVTQTSFNKRVQNSSTPTNVSTNTAVDSVDNFKSNRLTLPTSSSAAKERKKVVEKKKAAWRY